MRAPIHVVAGVLRDDHGRVLVAQRPAGKHLAGLWEFPGGKCEPGEAPQAALRRELHEEIGVRAGAMQPLIAVTWAYPEKSILLDVYRVLDWAGDVHGREGQALRWMDVDGLAEIDMPAADRPVVAALRLPPCYAVTPEPTQDHAAFLRLLARVLDSGVKLLQLRSKDLPNEHLRSLATRAQQIASSASAQLLLNGNVALAGELGMAGVHLPAAELLRSASRPLPADRWVGASCHDERELAHAAGIGVDFAVVGPVLPTATHPQAAALGWSRFSELCAAAQIPVYALGGLAASDHAHAVAAGAQGIAGISAFWPKD
jgi:8-oxo-dGTP diphosphatase